MLDLLRRKAQSPLIQGTILIIALVFIFWGGWRNYSGNRNVVAQVNDEAISYEQFQKVYERLADQYRDQFGGNMPKGLLESLDVQGQAIEQLIQRSLLRQGAREMGIVVSNLEVQQAIEKMEAFRDAGGFSVEQYKNIITSSGMTPTSFEETMRTDLLAGKVTQFLIEFAKLTPLEVKEQFNFDNEQIKIESVAFSGADFRNKVESDEAVLKAYYDENQNNYMTEPQVKLNFLVFPFDTETKPAISDEDIEAFYRQNYSRYSVPEQRHARHILIKTSAEDSEDTLSTKKQKAEQILALARSGEDFAALAKQYSEGPTGPKGGDLGFFSRGRMVKPFDDAVFALKEGEISDIVETQFGFHIIKLEKIEPARTKPLSEVRDEIESQLQAKKSGEAAFSKATEAYEKIILAGSLEKYSQNNDITVEKTDFFPKDAPGKSGSSIAIISEPSFLDAAFSLNKGELSSLIETPQGYAIIFAVDKKDPEVALFSDVEKQVRDDYINARSETLADEAAKTMLTALQAGNGEGFAAEAGKFDKTPEVSAYITRSNISGAKLPAEVVTMAFELSENNPLPAQPVAADSMFYVFMVKEKREPVPQLFSEKENEFRIGLLERKKSEILTAWLANVRDKAEIEINQQFL